MDTIIFTEEFANPENLFPFSLTRQVQDIRVGILTIREKWERMLGMKSADRRQHGYKDHAASVETNDANLEGNILLIRANLLPSPKIAKVVLKMKHGEAILDEDGQPLISKWKAGAQPGSFESIALNEPAVIVDYPWDIISRNDQAIRADFGLLTGKRRSRSISSTNRVVNPKQIFIERGARVEHSILNAAAGPIYIGRDAEVMEGCMIRGPFALGNDAVLKMGAKVYGATSLGPRCIGAGEIKNCVFFGYSNKAHDGYLGDSVIGEWCNMGAGTTNSNLKNNAGIIRMWTPNGPVDAGRKCGVMMGDYTRTAINTSINTGTVMGIGSNVFSNGLTPKYIPNFSWGTGGGERYEPERALRDIEAWKQLKQQSIDEREKVMLRFIYEMNQ